MKMSIFIHIINTFTLNIFRAVMLIHHPYMFYLSASIYYKTEMIDLFPVFVRIIKVQICKLPLIGKKPKAQPFNIFFLLPD